jgi:hypothetical protein
MFKIVQHKEKPLIKYLLVRDLELNYEVVNGRNNKLFMVEKELFEVKDEECCYSFHKNEWNAHPTLKKNEYENQFPKHIHKTNIKMISDLIILIKNKNIDRSVLNPEKNGNEDLLNINIFCWGLLIESQTTERFTVHADTKIESIILMIRKLIDEKRELKIFLGPKDGKRLGFKHDNSYIDDLNIFLK